MMEVQFLEENHRKKFAIIPYREYLRLVELVTEESDYRKALKILKNDKDKIVDYESEQILTNPITAKREEFGLSQRDLARRMRVNPSYISRLEKKGANPSKKTLEKVARALGCLTSDLV